MMVDYISRAAVLTLPRNITRTLTGHIVEETVNVADIEEMSSELQWYPCSKKLPEKDGDYLVTGRLGVVNKRKYEGGRWYGGWTVLAWMPLPEPYREEGEQ